jgi:hypothetical protein
MNKQQPQKVPVGEIIFFLSAINDRNWNQFKALEKIFVDKHDVKTWEHVLDSQIKPVLDKDSVRWLLIQWCKNIIVNQDY